MRSRVVLASLLAAIPLVAGLLLANASPVSAQGGTGPCSVTITELQRGLSAVDVSPPDGIAFIQPPGFVFVVVNAGGNVVREAVIPDGETGPVLVDTRSLAPGRYTIEASLVTTCTTTFYIDSLLNLNQPPEVDVECGPNEVDVGTVVSIDGASFDNDGFIEAEWWTLPDGTEVFENSIDFTITQSGTFEFVFSARDNRGEVTTATCSIAASSSSTSTPAVASGVKPACKRARTTQS